MHKQAEEAYVVGQRALLCRRVRDEHRRVVLQAHADAVELVRACYAGRLEVRARPSRARATAHTHSHSLSRDALSLTNLPSRLGGRNGGFLPSPPPFDGLAVRGR